MTTKCPIRHAPGLEDLVLRVEKSIEIAAPIDAAWEAVLAQFGPMGTEPDGTPLNLVLEPFPGGRWYRDLGNDQGHLWGHVQVIKPSSVLEIQGPMFMSYPVAGHIGIRLEAHDDSCTVSTVHTALGLIADEHREGVDLGWQAWCERVRTLALKR